MKAALRKVYGNPDVIEISEVEIPAIKDNEVLVKVFYTTVNRTDCAILTGKPFIMQLFLGLGKPRSPFLGTDFAGKVEAVGSKVTNFKVGDSVWGFNDQGIGSQAAYLSIAEHKEIVHLPPSIDLKQAAASAEAAHYAYNFINKLKLKSGQKVMLNGATGAIGSAMLQFLKYYDLEITVTCKGEHAAKILEYGAKRVIDYTQEDFTQDPEKYDYVLDAVGKSSFGKCKKLLKEKGIYTSSELGEWSQNPFLALLTAFSRGKKVIFPIPFNPKASFEFISKLSVEGKFKPLMDRTYPLENIAEAYTYVLKGEKIGNVMIEMPK